MDSKNHVLRQQIPFYLFGRYRFKSKSVQSLTTQLNGIHKELRREIKKLPRRKNLYPLEHFLEKKYGIDEEIRHVQLFQKHKVSLDDCSLTNTMEQMRTCYFSKQLVLLSVSEMKGFQLQRQPEGMQVFPPELTGEEDSLFGNIDDLDDEKKEEGKKWGKTAKGKENVSSLILSPINTRGAPPVAKYFSKQTVAVESVETSSKLSADGMYFHHYQNNNPSAIAKKSVAAALRGVRSRFGNKGRGRGSRSRIVERESRVHSTPKIYAPSTRRGRGRPRKNAIPAEEFLKQNPPSSADTSSPSPPSPAQSDETTYSCSITEMSNLKMRIKLHKPLFDLTSTEELAEVPTPSSLSTYTDSDTDAEPCLPQNILNYPSDRPKLILKIQLPQSSQNDEYQIKVSEEDEDDKYLDLY